MLRRAHIINPKRSNVVMITTLLLYLLSFTASAQVGGKRSFEFLNVPQSARLSGLGGVNVSLADHDVNFFYANPALSGDTLSGYASVNYQFYLADIGQAVFTYAHHFEKLGMISMGIQHMSYGSLQGYDQTGLETNTYAAGETALQVANSHQVNNFRIGLTLKGVFSNIAGYRASALAADIGGLFIHPRKQFTIGLVFKNIGVVLSDYRYASRSTLPFDVQLGTTIKPEHMPVRFSLSAFQLSSKAAAYDDPQDAKKAGTLQRIMSHANIGAEILLHKHVTVLVGYNMLNHQALKLTSGGSGAGVCFGFSANIKSFDFVFSRNTYVTGNAGYSFTLSKNINKLLKRR